MICKISKYEWIFSIISRIIHNLQFFLSKKKKTLKKIDTRLLNILLFNYK